MEVTKPKDFISNKPCNNCRSRKVKCSRQLPSCGHCLSRKESCSYFKKTNLKFKDTLDINNFVIKRHTKLTNKSTTNKHHHSYQQGVFSSKTNSALIQSNSRTNNDPPKAKLIKINPSSVAVSGIISATYLKLSTSWFSLFSAITGVGIKEYFLHEKYSRAFPAELGSFISKPDQSLVELKLVTKELKHMIRSSFEAYFTYINPYTPLFVKSLYFKRTRSRLLNHAIIASGVRLLPQTKKTELFLEYYLRSLSKLFTQVPRKPTLEYIQTLLVIHIGLQGLEFHSKIGWTVQSLTFNISHCLGLHFPSPVFLPPDLKLERYLAYVSILNYDSLTSRFLRSPGLFSNFHSGLKPKSILRFSSGKGFDFYSTLLVAQAAWYHTNELQKLCWARQLISLKFSHPQELRENLNRIISRLVTIYSDGSGLLQTLKTQFTCNLVQKKITFLDRFLKVINQDCQLFAISLYFDTFDDSVSEPEIRNALLIISNQVDTLESFDLSTEYLNRVFFVAFVAILLIKLSKVTPTNSYQTNIYDQMDVYFNRCLRLLKKLSGIEPLKSRALMLITAIELS